MPISSQEFADYGGIQVPKADPTPPAPYSKSTRTSFGRATAWTRQPGMGISKQSVGSFLSFDDDGGQQVLPESDKGAKFLKG